MTRKTVLAIAAAALIGLGFTTTSANAYWRGGPGWHGGGWHGGWGWRGGGWGYRPWGYRPWGWGAVGAGVAIGIGAPWGYPYGYPYGYYGYSYPTFDEVDYMPCLQKVWLSKKRWTWRRVC